MQVASDNQQGPGSEVRRGALNTAECNERPVKSTIVNCKSTIPESRQGGCPGPTRIDMMPRSDVHQSRKGE